MQRQGNGGTRTSSWDRGPPLLNQNRNRNRRQGGGGGEQGNNVNTGVRAGSSALKQSNNSTIKKFEEAKVRMQEAAMKYKSGEYESSSEEEDLEETGILSSLMQSYAQVGGKSEDLGRTQTFLEEIFHSGAATCLICIGSVKRLDPIWSCSECFCLLHLTCIQRWAKDSIVYQKQQQENQPSGSNKKCALSWPCPKCRRDYDQAETPQKYVCFCGQKTDPAFHPWLVPHSCGETCRRPLKPLCGHTCLLLCHPGPCPPCPKMVKNACYCGKQAARLRRCSQKMWSCGDPCGRVLSCGSHRCIEPCHEDACQPCPKKSEQPCCCGNEKRFESCSSPAWHCTKVCNKNLSCGNHKCEVVCHSGPCDVCPRSRERSCPCGKKVAVLACTEDVPPCGDTCNLVLDCGRHCCPSRCHRGKCGICLEVVTKSCRCGLHKKEIPCAKEYLCETKCKRLRDCGQHNCNRKCCDGCCPPCEKICGRTLPCGQHKCESICHRGACYPCPLSVPVRCRCGLTVISVPCGRQKKTKPPRCSQPCSIPPDCHHPSRSRHSCHFGECPPCQQICGKKHEECGHPCPESCHSAVKVKVEPQIQATGPWEKRGPVTGKRNFPCPPCEVPVKVTCIGGHETMTLPCHRSQSYSCGRRCQRKLQCGNHTCNLPCHAVENVESIEASASCDECDKGCQLSRPKGCSHECPWACHPPPCPACRNSLKVRCHCSVTQLYIRCVDWTAEGADRSALSSCGNQCPKNYPCGHRCVEKCHDGDCPRADSCKKKVKIYCPCRRQKREVTCDVSRTKEVTLKCNEECQTLRQEKIQAELEEAARKNEAEEERQRLEAERFQRKLEGRKRVKHCKEVKEKPKSSKKMIYIACIIVLSILFAIYFIQL